MKKRERSTTMIFNGLKEKEHFKGLFEELDFSQYLEKVADHPRITRNAYQRLFDAISYFGKEEKELFKEKVLHYKFFDDPFDGEDQLFGLEESLTRLVKIVEAGAHGYGQQKRILLLVGPVGSAKSTIARILRKGLEFYSRLEEGALYAPFWYIPDDYEQGKLILGKSDLVTDDGEKKIHKVYCPIHEEPLNLLPKAEGIRSNILEELNRRKKGDFPIQAHLEACPLCRFYFNQFLRIYNGDWRKVFENHVGVWRVLISEKDRVGIAVIDPKDPKSQDATELTGDINYRKLAEYGAENDPRAFNFRYGAFLQANRGIFESIEILKMIREFLYEFLTASQERQVKPKGFSLIDIDTVIIGHTNAPEFLAIQADEKMEAFRDRTLQINVPYQFRLQDEIKIYERDYNPQKVRGKHIAPHTLEIGALWAILTRLEPSTKRDLTLIEKLKLYDGKTLPKYTQETARELRLEAKNEGLKAAISPRYIQDKLSNILVSEESPKCANFFMLLTELKEGLPLYSSLPNEADRERCRQLLETAKMELDEILKNQVQSAMIADRAALERLCSNYVDNVFAYINKEKVRDPITGEYVESNERLMRDIEEKVEPLVQESQKDDFRNEIIRHIATLERRGKKFTWDASEKLRQALEKKLFEERKDTYKITSVVSTALSEEDKKRIDEVKARLKEYYGYCDECADATIRYVADIWTKGRTKK
jgi:serine protein kinase